MADDPSKRDYRDKTRINPNQKYEMAYWKDRLGVTGQQLAGAIRSVGSSVKRVTEYLKERKRS